MTLPAASGRHLSMFEKWPKMPHVTALFALTIVQCSIKPNAVSKASSNLSSEEYRQRLRTKRRGVSPSQTWWWASCYEYHIATNNKLFKRLTFFF